MELGLGGVLRFHTDHRGFNVVRGSLNSRRCHHGLHRFPTSVGDSFIIPLFIVGFPGEEAVIILPGRGDLGHGVKMAWNEQDAALSQQYRAVFWAVGSFKESSSSS